MNASETDQSAFHPKARLVTGVDEDLIRLSIGLEDEGDIRADLSQALDAI